MSKRKYIFIDRDGTLIVEPEDKQIDSLDKLQLIKNVIPCLLRLKNAGYQFVMVTNQDGLGTSGFPCEKFNAPQELLVKLFASQGIQFEAIRICPHIAADCCDCRKPKIGLLLDYLQSQIIDRDNSYVVGDRDTDLQLAENLGIKGICINAINNWDQIADKIIFVQRQATVSRKTNETDIKIQVNLDQNNNVDIDTGIGFFNHMLEQIANHGNFGLTIKVKGDLAVDDHHTIEDTGLALGECLNRALGDKRGVERYGCLLPMDESLSQIALDLSGRPYFVFTGSFPREAINGMATEMVPHFFRSLSESLKASLHIEIRGENCHHMVEAIFKGFGRVLKQAINKQGDSLPSTKGAL